MRQIKLIIAALFLISPIAANAGYIEVTVSGGTSNFYQVICDPFDPDCNVMYSVINGHLLLEFSESDWISDGVNPRYQFPTLLSYDFEWNLVHFATQTTLAEDSCETGDGFGIWDSWYPFVEYSSGADYEPNSAGGIGGFACSTPTSYMNLFLSSSESFLAEFYDPYFLSGSDHSTSYTVTIISEPVSEPGTLALLTIGLFGMGLSRRRKQRR